MKLAVKCTLYFAGAWPCFLCRATDVVLEDVCALQLHGRVSRTHVERDLAMCVPLTNRDVYFTAKVAVGSPAATFDLVADTGSNNLIVPSCHGARSTSCVSSNLTDGSRAKLMFGSGSIDVAIVTDVASVGELKVQMPDALLLMMGAQLNFGGAFEGILGLGRPNSTLMIDAQNLSSSETTSRYVPSFAEVAGARSFSMCLGPSEGFLHFNVEVREGLGTVTHDYWALHLSRVSVGDAPWTLGAPILAIPDSGTTMLALPMAHLHSLLGELCEAWPRCRVEALRSQRAWHVAFSSLLYRCQEWMPHGDGLRELPMLQLEVSDLRNRSQVLEIFPHDYVVESQVSHAHYILEWLQGLLPHQISDMFVNNATDLVCLPGFSEVATMSSPTWILGTALFFEYTVGFDLKSSPPSMSFNRGVCQCEQEVALVGQRTWSSTPSRRISQPVRVPQMPRGRGAF